MAPVGVAAWFLALAIHPFERFFTGDSRVRPSDGVLALALVLALLALRRRSLHGLPWWAVGALLAYAVLGGATVVVGEGGPDGATLALGGFGLVGYALTAALALQLSAAARRAVGLLFAVLAAVVFVLVAVGLVLFFLGHPTELVGTYGDLPVRDWYARAQAGFAHPNLLASWCIVASTIVAWSGAANRPWLRRSAQVLLAITVLTTFSRAILGFAVAAAWRSGRRTLALGVTAAAVVVVVGLVFVNPRPEGGESVRQQTIASAAETVIERPLFGVGLGNLPADANGGAYRAHLTPLDIAATQGIPSLLALVVALVVLWRRQRRPTDLILWGGMAGLAVDALGQDIQHFRHVWLLLGLVAAACRDDDLAARCPSVGAR